MLPILLGVAGVVVVGVVILLVTGVFGGGSGPESAVKNLVSATKSGDCDGMFDAVDFSDQPPLEAKLNDPDARKKSCDLIRKDAGLAGVELVKTEVSNETDTTATVKATVKTNGKEDTKDLKVKKVDGKWKIISSSMLK